MKTYTHRRQLLINDDGEIVELRCSFDKENFFIRSVNLLTYVNDFNGSPIRKYIPLGIIKSDKSEQQILGINETEIK